MRAEFSGLQVGGIGDGPAEAVPLLQSRLLRDLFKPCFLISDL
jgi:hypothetical protein